MKWFKLNYEYGTELYIEAPNSTEAKKRSLKLGYNDFKIVKIEEVRNPLKTFKIFPSA